MARRKHSDIIDVRGLFKTYVSKWYLFVISIVGCLILGAMFSRIHRTKYGVRANVLIQQEDANPLASMGGLGELFGSSGYVDDEIFVISSHSLYRDVVKDLGLNRTHYVKTGFLKSELSYPDFPIDVYTSAGVADTLKSALTFKVKVSEDGKAYIRIKDKHGKMFEESGLTLPHTFKTPYGEFTVDRTDYFPKGESVTSNIVFTGYHAAAEDLALLVSSEIANKKSNVIEMSYNTPNAIMGEMILQDIIDKYNERGIYEKNLQGQKTAAFIEQRLELLGQDLASAEGNIQNFMENNGIIDVKSEAVYQTNKRASVEGQLLRAETELEVLGLTRDFVTDPANKYELIPSTIESEALATQITEYNNTLIYRNEMARNVSEDNQAFIRVNNRIESMRAAVISTINRAYDSKQMTVRDLRSQLGSTSNVLGSVPGQERAVVDMKRQLEVKQSLYLFLRQRQEENAMLMANAVPKGMVVDKPYTLKKPIGLTTPLIMIIAFLFGLFLTPVYLYILKLMRNRIETRDDVERRTSAPILGEMCTDDSGRQLVVHTTDTSSATELFRLMRSNLLFMFNDDNDKVVLLTSSTSGEGKTFIAINLAATLALLGKKVLLVGMDIRAPKISSYLGVSSSKGLTQYLSSNDIALDSIIAKHPVDDIDSLDVIVAGPIPPNPGELLASKKVDQLFEQLRGMYDYIVVDSAPVGMVSDTFNLNRISDATVYVSRLNYTSISDIDFIEEIYADNRLKKLSVVINGVKSKKTYGYHNKKGAKAY